VPAARAPAPTDRAPSKCALEGRDGGEASARCAGGTLRGARERDVVEGEGASGSEGSDASHGRLRAARGRPRSHRAVSRQRPAPAGRWTGTTASSARRGAGTTPARHGTPWREAPSRLPPPPRTHLQQPELGAATSPSRPAPSDLFHAAHRVEAGPPGPCRALRGSMSSVRLLANCSEATNPPSGYSAKHLAMPQLSHLQGPLWLLPGRCSR